MYEPESPYHTWMITITVGENGQLDYGQWMKTSEQYLKRQLHWAWPPHLNRHWRLFRFPTRSKVNDS